MRNGYYGPDIFGNYHTPYDHDSIGRKMEQYYDDEMNPKKPIPAKLIAGIASGTVLGAAALVALGKALIDQSKK